MIFTEDLYMQKMLQLRLNDSFRVPVFELEGYKETSCLLDTGAEIAVWCSGRNHFLEIFQDAVNTDTQVLLSGFGGSGEFADVYKIPLLELKSADESIRFRNVYAALLNRSRFGFDFILPAVMFSKTDYKINNCCESPNLQVYFSRDMFLSVTRMRKFTRQEAEALRSEFGIEVPAGMEIVDSLSLIHI